jgi:hypothetical protein
MTKRWRQLQETLDQVSSRLDQLERHTDNMQTILMLREPSSTVAADAYEGLRKQVVTAVADRMSHLSQLVQLDTALSHGADTDSLAKVVGGWVDQASLARITDPGVANSDMLFALVEDLGGPAELMEPAYVDTITGRVIRQGKIRRVGLAPETEVAVGTQAAPGTGGAVQPVGRHGRRPADASADGGAAGTTVSDGSGSAGGGPLAQGDQAARMGEGTQ